MQVLTLLVFGIKHDPIMQKWHILFEVFNHVCGMPCITVLQVTDRNRFKYNKSREYFIETGYWRCNNFYVADEVNIICL